MSDVTFRLYFEWEERRQRRVVRGVGFEAEEDTLQFMCMSRGETLPELWPKLRLTSVFSEAFVNYIDGVLSGVMVGHGRSQTARPIP